MQNHNEKDDSWSLSSAFNKANKFTLKYLGMMGIPFYIFAAKAAATEMSINPDATLLDAGERFYSGVYDAAIEDFIPGTSFVIGEIFNFAADTIIPGMGTFISAVTNAPA